MAYANKTNNVWTELSYGQDVINAEGTQASYATIDLWSEDERNSFGVFTVPEPAAPPSGQVEASRVLGGDAAPAWTVTYMDPPPPPVPETISDRQFFQQLAVQALITQDEALAAVKTGEIPSAMQALVSQLPAEQQFPAQMLLCGATQFERSNAFTLVIGQLYGWDATHLDSFWRAAAAL